MLAMQESLRKIRPKISMNSHSIRKISELVGWGGYIKAFQKGKGGKFADTFIGCREESSCKKPVALELSAMFKECYKKELERGALTSLGVGVGHGFVSIYDEIANKSILSGFGLNGYSQLGTKTNNNPSVVNLEIPGKVLQIECGREHTLLLVQEAIEERNKVYVAGSNVYGQLGEGEVNSRDSNIRESTNIPLEVNESHGKIIQIQAGMDHSVLLTDQGKVFSMGWGADGQPGSGCTKNVTTPNKVLGFEDHFISAISTSTDFTFALTNSGELFCWGNGEYGNNMLGSERDKILTAEKVKFKFGKIISAAAGGAHSLVVNDDGHVYVCGCGALGLGEETTHITTPLRIPGLRNIVAVKASTDYSCAIDEAGRLFIWGLNNFCGILGNGSTDHHYNPILIEAPGSANTHLRFLPENLSVGNSFSLAFLS